MSWEIVEAIYEEKLKPKIYRSKMANGTWPLMAQGGVGRLGYGHFLARVILVKSINCVSCSMRFDVRS